MENKMNHVPKCMRIQYSTVNKEGYHGQSDTGVINNDEGSKKSELNNKQQKSRKRDPFDLVANHGILSQFSESSSDDSRFDESRGVASKVKEEVKRGSKRFLDETSSCCKRDSCVIFKEKNEVQGASKDSVNFGLSPCKSDSSSDESRDGALKLRDW